MEIIAAIFLIIIFILCCVINILLSIMFHVKKKQIQKVSKFK